MTTKTSPVERETIELTGVLYYASIQAPRVSTFAEKTTEAYQLAIGLTQDEVDELEESGVMGRRKAKKIEGAPKHLKFVNFSRKTTMADGTPRSPLVVVDRKANVLKDLVGNGSTAKIVLEVTRKIHPTYGAQVYVDLVGVQVIDLIPYTAQKTDSKDFTPKVHFTNLDGETTSHTIGDNAAEF